MEYDCCDMCDGDGKCGAYKCSECNGKGWVDYVYKSHGVMIAPIYLQKVATLGPVEFAIDRNPFKEIGTPVLFRFDGGDGILCPLID